jgi:hypothetical protein
MFTPPSFLLFRLPLIFDSMVISPKKIPDLSFDRSGMPIVSHGTVQPFLIHGKWLFFIQAGLLTSGSTDLQRLPNS